jgi:hypothetical protein
VLLIVDFDEHIGNAKAWRVTFGEQPPTWRSKFRVMPEPRRMSTISPTTLFFAITASGHLRQISSSEARECRQPGRNGERQIGCRRLPRTGSGRFRVSFGASATPPGYGAGCRRSQDFENAVDDTVSASISDANGGDMVQPGIGRRRGFEERCDAKVIVGRIDGLSLLEAGDDIW